ncbi:MAG TPA: hypothetical protein VGL22_02645 [Terracidiphilus sp.]|jgi:hypothetical protein
MPILFQIQGIPSLEIELEPLRLMRFATMRPDRIAGTRNRRETIGVARQQEGLPPEPCLPLCGNPQAKVGSRLVCHQKGFNLQAFSTTAIDETGQIMG